MSPVQEDEGPNSVSQLARKVSKLCLPQIVSYSFFLKSTSMQSFIASCFKAALELSSLWLHRLTFHPVSRCKAPEPEAGTGCRRCSIRMMNTSFLRRRRGHRSLTSKWTNVLISNTTTFKNVSLKHLSLHCQPTCSETRRAPTALQTLRVLGRLRRQLGREEAGRGCSSK